MIREGAKPILVAEASRGTGHRPAGSRAATPQKRGLAGTAARRCSCKANGRSATAATSPRAAMKLSGPTWSIADFWNKNATPHMAAARSRAISALRRDMRAGTPASAIDQAGSRVQAGAIGKAGAGR